MKLISDPRVKDVFDHYPKSVQPQLLHLRKLVMETALEIDGLDQLEETLRWGEPSYLTKHGSTVRMDWKKKNPDRFALYFKCTSTLVETFKKLYGSKLRFEGNRAIVFPMNEVIPEKEVKHYISLALTYHQIKHLPFLGA